MLEAPVVLLVMFIALITLIVLGFHIFVVLGMVSLVGTYLLFGDLGITLELASSSAYAVLEMPFLLRYHCLCSWESS